ncbi:hypothetical protein QE357_005200 [Siphonobacter sp. BAB-5404]|nr:hypothetical protein [Siphonobacter sp. SORGH_AS_0500]
MFTSNREYLLTIGVFNLINLWNQLLHKNHLTLYCNKKYYSYE